MMLKCYSEMLKFDNFQDRYEYLKLNGNVGEETFGYDRYLNQVLYRSEEWKKFRRKIILRDDGCDLAIEGNTIYRGLVIHHINPITKKQVLERNPCIFDTENVVCVSDRTHKAIHYGTFDSIDTRVIERRPNDMCPWKH